MGTIAGTIFGVLMALSYRWRAWRLDLPKWTDLNAKYFTEDEAGW